MHRFLLMGCALATRVLTQQTVPTVMGLMMAAKMQQAVVTQAAHSLQHADASRTQEHLDSRFTLVI
jgi:hypothetical protein